MVPFSLAFLLPLAAARWLAVPLPWIVAASAAAIAASLLRGRSRAPVAAAIAAGVLLFASRAADDRIPSRLPPAPEAIPVEIEGTVAGPCTPARGGGCTVPLAGLPALHLPGDLLGPLPGTRLGAIGRLDPRGHRIHILDSEGVRVLERPPLWHPGALFERLRRRLRDALDEGVKPSTSAHLKTLLLGDRGLPPEERERLARTGTLHLFAVSGMHLILLLGVLRTVVGPRPRFLLFALTAYAALSGFASPVGRALLTSAGALLARRLERRPRPAAHYLLSLTLVLAWDPSTAEQAGFVLSFAAYAGILFLALPALERERSDPFREIRELSLRGRLWARLGPALAVSVAAFATSLLPSLLLFHRISPAAIPGTMLLAPVVDALLVVGLLLSIVPAAPPLVFLADAGVGLLEATTKVLDATPGASFTVAAPNLLAILLWTASLVAVHRRLVRRGRVRPAILAALASLALLCVPGPPREMLGLLDAGRGTALLARSDAFTVLLDCGPADSEIAEQVLDRGIGALDAVLLSHDHEDHAGGLRDVVRRLDVGAVLAADPESGRYDADAALRRGDVPLPGIEVGWPPAGAAAGGNDGSAAVRLVCGAHAVWTCGDLETRGLRAWLRLGIPSPCDILVLPHHGARNDALPDLLCALAPDEAWLPARPGFPDESTMMLAGWLGFPLRTSWVAP